MFRIALPLAALALTALPAVAQPENWVWTYHRFVEPSPLNTYLGLVYGIPETDAIRASISCSIGANWIFATVELEADVGAYRDGETVALSLSAPGYAETLPATVLRQEEGLFWGVSAALPLDSPFWGALSGDAVLSYRLAKGPAMALPLQGADYAAGYFLDDCHNIADLPPDTEGEPPAK